MNGKISRRKFLKQSGSIGLAAAGASAIPGISGLAMPTGGSDIAVVQGENYFENTLKAIDMIGGIDKFVPSGSKVGLLINSDFDIPGTYVNPDIAIAVVNAVTEAGAAEICCLQHVKEEYWKRSSHYEKYKTILDMVVSVEKNVFPSEFNEDDFIKIHEIEGAKALHETEVVKKWLACDVFINIPVSKHHPSTLLTGALKNIMGVSTRKANVTFHLGSGKRNDPEYLAQCIADQHLLRKTDLCIIDSTSFITDNGLSGPGTIKKADKVLAGTDIIALDALAATFLGFEPEDILCVTKGHELGLGNMNYRSMNIMEIQN